MAQVSLREYDVKKMFSTSIGQSYTGIQLQKLSDIEQLSENTKYVIKPDMLFGKRGKRGLLGINLSKNECKTWFKKYLGKSMNIDGVDGTLDVFLVEECINPVKEYYISFSQTREGDLISYSDQGGVDIEENWDSTHNITIPMTKELKREDLVPLIKGKTELQEFILQLWKYYRSHGFVFLEFNPIAEDSDGNFILLDAVAKVDDQEGYLQKDHWKNIEIPNSYGFQENTGERYIRELDSQTGASLKIKILNPHGRIWTLFAGGGGSLVMTDTLGALGYAQEIGNYGECSGNPSREFTREYTKTLLEQMLHGGTSQGKKYLIIAGAIANFTHIDTTFQGVIDALEIYQEEIHKQNVEILVRRGGINEKKGLKILEDACKKLKIPALITGSDAYMTDILQDIKL